MREVVFVQTRFGTARVDATLPLARTRSADRACRRQLGVEGKKQRYAHDSYRHPSAWHKLRGAIRLEGGIGIHCTWTCRTTHLVGFVYVSRSDRLVWDQWPTLGWCCWGEREWTRREQHAASRQRVSGFSFVARHTPRAGGDALARGMAIIELHSALRPFPVCEITGAFIRISTMEIMQDGCM